MLTKQTQQIDISFGTFLRFFAILALVAAAYYLLQVVAALVFATVIASALEPTILWAQEKRVPRIATVVVIYCAALLLLAGLTYLVLPAVAQELQNFIASYPIYQRELLRQIQDLSGVPLFNLLSDNTQEIFLTAPEQLTKIAANTFQLTVNIFGGVMLAVVTAVVSFYLAAQEKGIESFLRLVVPLEYEEYAIDLWGRAQRKMGQWLRAQLLLGAIIGILVYIALSLLGVRFALAFAVVAAIFELIPVIGPIVAAVPAAMVAFVQSPLLGLTVVGIYVVIQQFESHFVVPTVMRRAIGMSPLVVVIALLVGGTLGGILGMLLAVPVTSIVVEFLTDTDRKKRGVFQYGGGSGN